jgi:hypothetical protein
MRYATMFAGISLQIAVDRGALNMGCSASIYR